MADSNNNIIVDERKKRLLGIIESYKSNALPLLFRLGKMQGYIPVNCLNEVRALNDHVARCFRDSFESENVETELSKSMGHVERLVLDCFKQLIVFVKDDIQSYEKKYFSTQWYYWDNGNFWDKYCELKISGEKSEIEAKIIETADKTKSLYLYETAYQDFQKIYDALSNHNLLLSKWYRCCFIVKKWSCWLLITLLSTVVVTLLKFFCFN